jgi:hypothetical protein
MNISENEAANESLKPTRLTPFWLAKACGRAA